MTTTNWHKLYDGAEHEMRKRPGTRTADHDDAVQEGVIGAWLALQKKDHGGYAWQSMRKRISSVLDGRAMLGSESETRRYEPRTAEFVDNAHDMPLAPEDRDASDIIPIIRRVLDLRSREVVFRRFWLDQDYPEIGAALGLSEHWAAKEWKKIIRPQLREALAHYETV